jgi:hypothetical protein
MSHALPKRAVAAVSVGLFVLQHAAFADDAGNMDKMALLPSADAIQWGEGPKNLPSGVELTVLAGDPSKPGPFVLRVNAPPNTIIAPHSHKTAENLTIISGVLYHEMGATLDTKAGDKLSGGGFVYLPGKMPHSVWTTSEGAVIQVTGTGPFGVDYVNPADDPSRK